MSVNVPPVSIAMRIAWTQCLLRKRSLLVFCLRVRSYKKISRRPHATPGSALKTAQEDG
jgi:hypothetical protein